MCMRERELECVREFVCEKGSGSLEDRILGHSGSQFNLEGVSLLIMCMSVCLCAGCVLRHVHVHVCGKVVWGLPRLASFASHTHTHTHKIGRAHV